MKEYSQITEFYIKRLLITIKNHLNNEKKFLHLNKIINNDFVDEMMIYLSSSECSLIQRLFERLIERLAFFF